MNNSKCKSVITRYLAKSFGSPMRHWVASDILEEEESGRNNLYPFLQDLAKHGCRNGVARSLIYYKDFDEFFNKFSGEILKLIDEMVANDEINLSAIEFNKNWFSWFAYECVGREILQEIEAKNE